MSTHHTLIDETTDEASPHHDESHHTISDISWVLSRFTGPGWNVTECEFEFNDHHGAASTVLDAALSHESGSILQINPLDPWSHTPGKRLYRKHRIRFRNAVDDSQTYITIDADETPTYDPDLAAAWSGVVAHPHPELDELCTFHSQKQVHSADGQIQETKPKHGRGYSVDSVTDAILAALAGATRVTKASQSQTGLDQF